MTGSKVKASHAYDEPAILTVLTEHCQVKNLGEVMYQDVSDRRGTSLPGIKRLIPNTRIGGRTAWSTIAVVNGMHYPARFWYDGARIEQAKEDAAEIALRQLTGCTDPKEQPPPAAQYGRALPA